MMHRLRLIRVNNCTPAADPDAAAEALALQGEAERAETIDSTGQIRRTTAGAKAEAPPSAARQVAQVRQRQFCLAYE